ncbi:Uncharacterized protein MCB1EB_1351 [Mycoavidus cysteinexigens]|uniref:Uncharacterized protein n=1 Tax=Mycoavidus cysteinexigens TaxID=1553431 RepID=A0A2Z6EVS7_9BURK|nr:VirB8/TrbF family protein [Mycoavidus cysteinexigens]BBE09512.1 Uncharacterized protein MCB1EB_1351 [Mycoavidus cysteinexigens]GAM51727.1 hypothetical protein EBME_0190 [bacterium endosymbiont of Mortierella elongata FMR23-6]GLR01334.1 hypothetical protein GCM10007934_11460 [Mycoavidus cysteinexigens]
MPLSKPSSQTENAPPPGATIAASQAWFAYFQKPLLNAKWARLAAAGFFILALIETIALLQLLKNAGPRPYFIEHDETSGAVYLSSRVAQQFTPNAANITYFLRIWATHMLSIKPDQKQTQENDIPAAAAWTVGAATKVFTEYFAQTDRVAERLAKQPGLTREVVENSTSYANEGGIAYMVLTLIERIDGIETKRAQKVLTANLILAPERFDEQQRRTNPIGLMVTHFTLTPYYGPNPSTHSAS